MRRRGIPAASGQRGRMPGRVVGLFLGRHVDGAARFVFCPALFDGDGLDFGFRHMAFKINVQQPVIQMCAHDLDALGQDEAALELTRRDAAVQVLILPVLIFCWGVTTVTITALV